MNQNPMAKNELSKEELNTVAGGSLTDEALDSFSKASGMFDEAEDIADPVDELTAVMANLTFDDNDDDSGYGSS